MDDAKPSLLYKVKPIGDRLPAVKRPEGHVHFRTKIMWVAVILILYFVMSNVYIWGLDQSGSLDMFAQYRTIMAGASGTILQLGIGPIVTASIIMQLFVGAKIIKLDLSNKKDKACYQSVMKVLVLVMILVEALPQVFGYLVPSDAFVSQFGSWGSKSLIILQLFIGSYLVFLFDEVISKWGIGSGISLFIAAGVAQAVFTGALNWYPLQGFGTEYALSNPPAVGELEGLEGIDRVEQVGPTRFKLHFDKSKETMQKVIGAAVAGGWGLSEAVLQKVSLDEIFAQLSGKREKGEE